MIFIDTLTRRNSHSSPSSSGSATLIVDPRILPTTSPVSYVRLILGTLCNCTLKDVTVKSRDGADSISLVL